MEQRIKNFFLVCAFSMVLVFVSKDLAAGASVRTSYFSVIDVSYGDGPVMAGTAFDCIVTVRVTDGDENIEGAVAVLELPYGLSFEDGNDRVFLGTLAPGTSYEASFRLRVDDNVRQTICNVSVQLSGTSSRFGIPLETKEGFQISVTPAERLKTEGLSLPEQINAAYDDGSGRLDFSLSNNGYVPVTEVEVFVRGDAFLVQEPFYIEEIQPSAKANVTLNLVTGEEGSHKGEIVISYLNVLGEKKEVAEPFVVEGIYHMPEFSHDIVIDPGMIKEVPAVPDWVWVPVTLGALVGAGLLYKKCRRLWHRTDT